MAHVDSWMWGVERRSESQTLLAANRQANAAKGLRDLYLQKCDLGEQSGRALGAALAAGGLPQLEQLRVFENPLGDAGGAALLRGLEARLALELVVLCLVHFPKLKSI